jgi:hypothetical protein
VKTPVDARLTNDAAGFAFRFACDDCVHFSPEREPTCGHGWPVRLRRHELEPSPAGSAESVAFCKEFELA